MHAKLSVVVKQHPTQHLSSASKCNRDNLLSPSGSFTIDTAIRNIMSFHVEWIEINARPDLI
jgi:hypothetical protein